MTILQAHGQASLSLSNGLYSREEAHSTARILLDDVVGASHVHLTRAQDTLTARQIERFEAALNDLLKGRPLAYILGTREFFGMEFHCDERGLIPRPETELLVEFALEQLEKQARLEPQRPLLVADMGTGTGCVAISIAKNFPSARVIATDVSPATLELARENARLHAVEDRMNFVPGKQGDWAAPLLSEGASAYDVIVSNPPYIAPRDIAELPVQIKDFEPRGALDGGPDGLDCYRQIARQCLELLAPGGVIACELGIGQFHKVQRIFEENGWKVGEPVLDLQSIERVVIARP
jgi:release factor glutamine methyltransferase